LCGCVCVCASEGMKSSQSSQLREGLELFRLFREWSQISVNSFQQFSLEIQHADL